MMIYQINTSEGIGSTGRIVDSLALLSKENGYSCTIVCGEHLHEASDILCTQKKYHYYFENFMSRVRGNEGFGAKEITHHVIEKFEVDKPRLIHIHNLHGHYINSKMIFDYIKQNDIPVVWTLHDTWAFTGKCPNYNAVGCDKWKSGCYNCPQLKAYPVAYVDNSSKMWKEKKKCFTGVKNMVIVTPSNWLKNDAENSFLSEYPIKVIPNGIDLNVFSEKTSEFRKKYKIENRFVILAVSFAWGYRKGLDVIVDLAKKIDNNMVIVVVGTTPEIDRILPSNVISIHKTNNQAELAEIYSTADVFINPTREDNFPTVNLEALACGTPVVTFNTGGSPECLDVTCGAVTKENTACSMYEIIKNIAEKRPYSKERCRMRAEQYEASNQFRKYIALYEEIIR